MFANMRGWEWLIVVAVVLLLFGAKRLPDTARGLGRSLRIFKAETKGLTGGDDEEDPPTQVAASRPPVAEVTNSAAPTAQGAPAQTER